MRKKNLAALLITLSVFIVLFLSGPVEGMTLGITDLVSGVLSSRTITFLAKVDLHTNDVIPETTNFTVNMLNLEGVTNFSCTFDINGTNLTACPNITVTLQSSNLGSRAYGYGYLHGYGYDYSSGSYLTNGTNFSAAFGYGYQNLAGYGYDAFNTSLASSSELVFNISWATPAVSADISYAVSLSAYVTDGTNSYLYETDALRDGAITLYALTPAESVNISSDSAYNQSSEVYNISQSSVLSEDVKSCLSSITGINTSTNVSIVVSYVCAAHVNSSSLPTGSESLGLFMEINATSTGSSIVTFKLSRNLVDSISSEPNSSRVKAYVEHSPGSTEIVNTRYIGIDGSSYVYSITLTQFSIIAVYYAPVSTVSSYSTTTSVQSSAGSGGVAGPVSVSNVRDITLTNVDSVIKDITVGSEIRFMLDGTRHSLILSSLDEGRAYFMLTPSISFSLAVSQAKEVDFNSLIDGVLYLRLINIKDGKADIVMKDMVKTVESDHPIAKHTGEAGISAGIDRLANQRVLQPQQEEKPVVPQGIGFFILSALAIIALGLFIFMAFRKFSEQG